MVSMCELTLKDDLLQIAQRRRHARDALAELDEVILDELLAKPGLQQPRLQMLEVPAIERELPDVIAAEQIAQLPGDELIRNRLSRRHLQEAAIAQTIVRYALVHRPLFYPNGRRQNRRMTLPLLPVPSDQNQRGEVRHLGKVEAAVDRQPVERPRGRIARLPHLGGDEGARRL